MAQNDKLFLFAFFLLCVLCASVVYFCFSQHVSCEVEEDHFYFQLTGHRMRTLLRGQFTETSIKGRQARRRNQFLHVPGSVR